jgi:ribosomal protein S12 methylthiotransferase
MRKNRVDIITLGCSKNLVDSERLMRQFAANGYTVAHDPSEPTGDTVVINTCGFIGAAKEESIQMILNFVEARKERRIHKLLVMGCLSERYREDLQTLIPEVDRFYGKFDWRRLLSDLGQTYHPELAGERMLTTPPHYAYLKIAEGCNRQCAYCSIPLITGPYHSRSLEDIEQEVRTLAGQGVREFQLIAQDLTYYGRDRYQQSRLAELLWRLAEIKGVEWIRLHYAYPAHFPLEILPVIRSCSSICNYLDIALQHCNDKVLKQMRRNSTRRETEALLHTLRAEVPGIHLRTTMMVGYPGETDRAFHELLDFVREMRFERLGAFSYSEEEGTWAAQHYPNRISDKTKQSRLDELLRVQEPIASEINAAKVGQTLRVIVDREESGFFIGRTEYDSPEVDPEVLIEKSVPLTIGAFYPIRITGAQSYDLLGTLASPLP